MWSIDMDRMSRISALNNIGGKVSDDDKKYYNENFDTMKLLIQSVNDHWQRYAKLVE